MTKINAKKMIKDKFPDEYRIHIMEIDTKKRQIEYSFSFDEIEFTEKDVRFQAIVSYFEEQENEYED